jgi:hypothetical protein
MAAPATASPAASPAATATSQSAPAQQSAPELQSAPALQSVPALQSAPVTSQSASPTTATFTGYNNQTITKLVSTFGNLKNCPTSNFLTESNRYYI